MAIYRNKKTGATITTDLIISGGDWEIEEKKKKENRIQFTWNACHRAGSSTSAGRTYAPEQ